MASQAEMSPVNDIVVDGRTVYVGCQDYISRWDLSRLYTGCYNLGF